MCACSDVLPLTWTAHLHDIVRVFLLQQSLDGHVGVAPAATVDLTEAAHADARPQQELFRADLPLVLCFLLPRRPQPVSVSAG